MIYDGHVKYHEDLQPLLRDIDTVQPHPANYNNGDLDALTESVETNGMYRPIYAQRSTGYIIAGNHTWMACKALGAENIPVVVLDVDDTQAKQIMVADNRIASLAMPDNGLLMSLLQEIDADAGSLVGTGYSDKDLEVLQHLNEIPLDTEEDGFAVWPTFSVQLPPHVLRGFMYLTDEAADDRSRFELLLRMAGWDGGK